MKQTEYYQENILKKELDKLRKEEEREEKEKKLVELRKMDDDFIRHFISRYKQIQSKTRKNNRKEVKGKSSTSNHSAKTGMTRQQLITIIKNLNKEFNEEGNE